jgi:hypothetical protein
MKIMAKKNNIHTTFKTYPFKNIKLINNQGRFLDVSCDKIKLEGKVVGFKENRVIRLEISDPNSIKLINKISFCIDSDLWTETNKSLDSNNVFDGNVIRFRIRTDYGMIHEFIKNKNISVVVRPENIYSGNKNSLNWVCEKIDILKNSL